MNQRAPVLLAHTSPRSHRRCRREVLLDAIKGVSVPLEHESPARTKNAPTFREPTAHIVIERVWAQGAVKLLVVSEFSSTYWIA